MPSKLEMAIRIILLELYRQIEHQCHKTAAEEAIGLEAFSRNPISCMTSLVDKATIDSKEKVFIHVSNIAAAAFLLPKPENRHHNWERTHIYMHIYV